MEVAVQISIEDKALIKKALNVDTTVMYITGPMTVAGYDGMYLAKIYLTSDNDYKNTFTSGFARTKEEAIEKLMTRVKTRLQQN